MNRVALTKEDKELLLKTVLTVLDENQEEFDNLKEIFFDLLASVCQDRIYCESSTSKRKKPSQCVKDCTDGNGSDTPILDLNGGMTSTLH